MTRKLEELFDLPPADVLGQPITAIEAVDNANATIEENKTALAAADEAIDKIDAALPTVRDLDTSDNELDDLADLAKNTFTDLIELSMNVEPRFSGPILQSASTLLGHAVTARIAKMDKKLKMVDLQIKKARLDKEAAADPTNGAMEGKGMIIDRNELLRQLLGTAQTPNTDK
jgi:galactitol-specific phosphotransferase system IIB component